MRIHIALPILIALIAPELSARQHSLHSLTGAPSKVAYDSFRRLASDDTEDLIEKLLADGEVSTSLRLYSRLAGKRSAVAMEGMLKIIDGLANLAHIRSAYNALASFRKIPALLPLVVGELHDAALNHKRVTHQRAAANALASLAHLAYPELEDVLANQGEDSIRSAVIVPLQELLAKRCDKQSLDYLFEFAPLAGTPRASLMLVLQGNHKDPLKWSVLEPYLTTRLKGKKRTPRLKLFLLNVISVSKSEAALEAIATCIDNHDSSVRLLAVELLGGSGADKYTKRLEKLSRSKDDATARQAIASLSKLKPDDEEWLRRVLRFSKDKRVGARMGAAVALAHSKNRIASERLLELLEDADWRVRTEALHQVGSQRRLTSVPTLIERLSLEEPRLQRDIARVLRLLTGLDHGRLSHRWSSWWASEGAKFKLPTYAQAVGADHARNKARGENASSSGFYGLEVISGNVAFVVDISGSMNAVARGRGSASLGRKVSRLDVAKSELATTIKSLADGVLFSLITFDSEVENWKKGQTSMDKKSRKEALAWIRLREYRGATNTWGGLMAAFGDESVDTVYLLSDGQPSSGELINPNAIRERLKRMNSVRKVRIHTISIGAKSPFLRGLAEDTAGRYVEVP